MSDRGADRRNGNGDAPWWASEDGATRVDPGPAAEDRPGGAGPSADRGPTDDPGDDHDASGGPGARDHLHGFGGGGDACTVCPICSLIRVVEDSRPEVVTHVVEAMRHLTQAAKVVIEAQSDLLGRPGGGLEHIPLDDE